MIIFASILLTFTLSFFLSFFYFSLFSISLFFLYLSLFAISVFLTPYFAVSILSHRFFSLYLSTMKSLEHLVCLLFTLFSKSQTVRFGCLTINQCFSTGVPRSPWVPWASIKGSAAVVNGST
jgi:hypothetical protein